MKLKLFFLGYEGLLENILDKKDKMEGLEQFLMVLSKITISCNLHIFESNNKCLPASKRLSNCLILTTYKYCKETVIEKKMGSHSILNLVCRCWYNSRKYVKRKREICKKFSCSLYLLTLVKI